jgi:hypothetical protein
MADVERELLSKAISSGKFDELVARGIESEHFVDDECFEIYQYCLNFMRLHKDPPSSKTIKKEFPGFKLLLSNDPLSYYLEQMVLKVKERLAIDLVRDYHEAIDDPEQLHDIELRAFDMARVLSEAVPAPRASFFGRDAIRRHAEYEERKRTGNIRGIYLGIPSIDEILLGMLPGQLVTIVAYMGIGKSVLMTYFAYSAYLQGKTSLFISLEMSADEILQRLDVIASNIKFQALKALDLEAGDQRKWYEILERAEADQHEREIIIRDDIQDCTVDHVFAEASRWKPDLCFVDYLELMSVPRTNGNYRVQGWEQVSNAGKGLKQNARLLHIPHITAAQLNREGGRDKVTLGNVGHQSIGKHSDIMLGLSQDEEQEIKKEMDVLSLKVRNGAKPRATLRWDLDFMDIGEKGIEDRFPTRRPHSQTMIGHQRRKNKRLEIARTVGGKENPWKTKTSHQSKPSPKIRSRRKRPPRMNIRTSS